MRHYTKRPGVENTAWFKVIIIESFDDAERVTKNNDQKKCFLGGGLPLQKDIMRGKKEKKDYFVEQFFFLFCPTKNATSISFVQLT